MGRTFKTNDRWKKDKRDRHFRESKKFKHFQHGTQHGNKPGGFNQPENTPIENVMERFEDNS